MSGALSMMLLSTLIIELTTRTVNKIGASPATATYSLNNNGSVSTHNGVTGELWDNQPPTTGNYWVQATLSSGSVPSGSALGSWLNLGTSRSWSITASGGSGVTNSCVLNVQIASDSGGANVVASATITIQAQVP